MRFCLRSLLIVVLLVLPSLAIAQNEPPPLNVAMLIPIEPWDRKAGLEAWRDWMQERYRVNITWIEPVVPLPNKDTPAADRKAYYANPPAIPNLERASDADVIFTALTHVSLNEKQSVELLKMLTTKPVVGGRRSHHALGLRVPKDVKILGIDNPGDYGRAIFGGAYAGHHGGVLRFKEGQTDHPIVKGLPELAKMTLFDRGYRHKDLSEDVTVLIETTAGEPQTWVRTNKATKLRSAYTVHDPHDITNHEAVRVMLTRALFWAAQLDEAKYRK
jgi:hypothetical protein